MLSGGKFILVGTYLAVQFKDILFVTEHEKGSGRPKEVCLALFIEFTESDFSFQTVEQRLFSLTMVTSSMQSDSKLILA